VGSLNETKNYPEFVNVIEMISSLRPDLRCAIIGADVENGRIRKHIEQSQAAPLITLMGELPYAQVLETMQQSKVLLHCAPFEGQALVITEALAAGMNVVCRPAGISAGMEAEQLFTANETSLLADRILQILGDPDTRYVPVAPFTIKETCCKYLELYSLLHDNAP
jgi:glycosyltransferase involved in cell wall biosynthesis